MWAADFIADRTESGPNCLAPFVHNPHHLALSSFSKRSTAVSIYILSIEGLPLSLDTEIQSHGPLRLEWSGKYRGRVAIGQ